MFTTNNHQNNSKFTIQFLVYVTRIFIILILYFWVWYLEFMITISTLGPILCFCRTLFSLQFKCQCQNRNQNPLYCIALGIVQVGKMDMEMREVLEIVMQKKILSQSDSDLTLAFKNDIIKWWISLKYFPVSLDVMNSPAILYAPIHPQCTLLPHYIYFLPLSMCPNSSFSSKWCTLPYRRLFLALSAFLTHHFSPVNLTPKASKYIYLLYVYRSYINHRYFM